MKEKATCLIAILACFLVVAWLAPGADAQDEAKAAADLKDESVAEADAAYDADMKKDKT